MAALTTIGTSRLVLRPWRFEDLADLLAYARDERWGRYLPVPQPYGEEDGKRFIATQVLRDPAHHLAWAMEHAGRAAGGMDLIFRTQGRIAEIGYSLAPDLWGQGLTTEAVRTVITEAFTSRPDLARICAFTLAVNTASARVLEKAGMRLEGVLRRNTFHRGELQDEHWFGILREEWPEARTRPTEAAPS